MYGTANLNNVIFYNTTVMIYGNKINLINNSVFYEVPFITYFLANSTTNIFNSNFSSNVDFGSSTDTSVNSKINLYNSNLLNNIRFYNTTVNFTGNSSMANTMTIGSGFPRLYGSVRMPSAYTISGTSKIMRYYPVQVRYTNSSTGVANKPVNITDYLTNLVWNGTTDSNGNIIANLTLNRTNYGNGNFTISVNPSDNISLSTGTPIIFDIPDSEPPTYGNNNNSPDSGLAYSPSQAYQFVVDWSDNNALDIVLIEQNFTGTLKNDSMSNSGSTYYYNINGLAAGSYVWRSCANDSSNIWNCSGQWGYNVNPASSSVNLLLNGIDNNLTAEVHSVINETALRVAGEGIVMLYENGNLANSGNNPLENLTQYNSTGIFNATVKYPPTDNYSESEETHLITIQDTTIPSVSLISPENNTLDENISYTFSCNATDNYLLKNMTIYIWNSTNDIINQTANAVSGTFNQSSWNITLPYGGSFKWNCLANDNSSNPKFAATNFTITADTTHPAITILSPQSITYSNASILVNITAIDSALDKIWFYNGTNNET